MANFPSDRSEATGGEPRYRITVWTHYDIEYELRQPDPSHWAAIGVVSSTLEASALRTRELVVGTGATESEAICDLRSRVMERYPMPLEMHDVFAVDWSSAGI